MQDLLFFSDDLLTLFSPVKIEHTVNQTISTYLSTAIKVLSQLEGPHPPEHCKFGLMNHPCLWQ